LQHAATVVEVVLEVGVVEEEVLDVVLLLVVGVGAELVLVELVLVVGVGDEVELEELVDVVVPMGADVELVELVLVVLPAIVVDEVLVTDVEVVELVLVLVEPPREVEVVDGGYEVELLVDEVLVVEVLVVVVPWSVVVVVPSPGFFSDGTQRSEARRQVPWNTLTNCCCVNWSATVTCFGRNAGWPLASMMR